MAVEGVFDDDVVNRSFGYDSRLALLLAHFGAVPVDFVVHSLVRYESVAVQHELQLAPLPRHCAQVGYLRVAHFAHRQPLRQLRLFVCHGNKEKSLVSERYWRSFSQIFNTNS